MFNSDGTSKIEYYSLYRKGFDTIKIRKILGEEEEIWEHIQKYGNKNDWY